MKCSFLALIMPRIMRLIMRISIVLFLHLIHGEAYTKQRVCIVGAGMAGLAAIKLLRDHPDDFETIAFEKNSDVGGLWIYTDNIDVDEHGLPVHSSMYKNLRTNLPKQLMTYPDYQKFNGPDNRSYVSHELVLEYLRNYTESFNLRENVKFDTLVEKVKPILGDGDWRSTKWSVETRNLNTNASDKTICDAMIVCNGAYFKPNIPEIPGIKSFPGRVLHSHTYRHPEEFKNRSVVLLGASASGIDIGIELTSYAKIVYLSHRHEKINQNFPENLVQVRGVVAANGNDLILQDSSTITADTFIFCTGYLFEFPFLDESSHIIVGKKNHVRPLYKYLINVEHPSMALIGVPSFFMKGPYFYSQVKFFLNLLREKISLPSYEVMIEDSERLSPGYPTIDGEEVHDPEWDYNADLAKAGGFELPHFFYKKALDLAISMSREVIDYKDYDLKLLDNGDPLYVRRDKA